MCGTRALGGDGPIPSGLELNGELSDVRLPEWQFEDWTAGWSRRQGESLTRCLLPQDGRAEMAASEAEASSAGEPILHVSWLSFITSFIIKPWL